MFGEKGQKNPIDVIMVVVIAGVMLAVGLNAFGELGEQTEEYVAGDSFSTTQKEFTEVTDWTLESTGALQIEHTGENIRLYSTNAENGAGTATISQEFEISSFAKISSATMKTYWYIENVDNFDAENTYLRLRDPSNNIDAELFGSNDSPGVTTEWQENMADVTDNIDESGTWTLEMYFESQDNGDGVNAYVDNSSAYGSTKDKSESWKITDDLWKAYGMTPILVIVLIAASIISILMVFKRR